MSADLLDTLLRCMLAASAAMAAILAFRPWLRRAFGARIAYAFWAAVPIAALAGFAPARRIVVESATSSPSAAPPSAVNTIPDAAMVTPAPTTLESLVAPWDITLLLLAFWLIGFIASLAFLVLGQRRLIGQLRLRRAENGLHVAVGDAIGPAVVGVVLPRIVVPADFKARYTEEERALVLEHERAHIRAGDVQANAVAAFLQCAMWFNPLAYFARAAFRVDQELACDERVMQRFASARRTYAEAMLKTQLAARAIPLGCAWPPSGLHPLKQRIAMLARPSIAAPQRAAGAALCALVTLGAGLTVWASQPPRAHAETQSSRNWLSGDGARLVQALMDGDAERARALIAAGADVNHWSIGDGTPLVAAARLEDAELVALLLRSGADANKPAPGEGTPLIVAARLDSPTIAALLLHAGADVNKPVRGDGNPLIAASSRGSLGLVQLFVEAGADVNAIVPADETPLINAAWHGHLDVARYLIEHGADPNLAVRAPIVDGSELRSPLIMARREGNAEMIALLEAAGAHD